MKKKKTILRRVVSAIMNYSFSRFIYLNFFCKCVKRKKGCYLWPGRYSVIVLDPTALIELDGSLYLNVGRIGHSRAEGYLIMGVGAKLHVAGKVSLRYGFSVQINNGAHAEFGSFSCNTGLNLQCQKRIEIGHSCMFGRNVVIYDSAYHMMGIDTNHMRISAVPVRIGNHVWLGTNVAVTQGSQIGDCSIIGLNSLISGKIEPRSMVVHTSDKPSSQALMWAKSQEYLDEAAQYYMQFGQENCDFENEADTEELEITIVGRLQNLISGIDFKNEEELITSGLLDSLTMLTVVMQLSEAFNVEIPFTEVSAQNFDSVHRMALLIYRLQQGQKDTEIRKNEKVTEQINLLPLKLDECDAQKTVVQRIIEHALYEPNNIAIIAEDKETTYEELCDKIVCIQRWLKANGVLSGDRVVVEAVHCDTCIAIYYAVHLTGAILVPVEKNAAQARILEIAEDTDASLIISRKGYDTVIPWHSYAELNTAIIGENLKWNYDEISYPNLDMSCEMIFTTGTTGKSKGVIMTHRSISWYSYSLAKAIHMKKGNRFFITTPLNHAGGLRRTHMSLANGCTLVYMDGMSDLRKYFEYIKKYYVTALYLPPVSIRILLTRSGKELSRFANQIDFVYSSSSSLPIGDCMALRELLPHTRLYNAYEASETPGVSVYDYNVNNMEKDCIGLANEGVELGVFTENGEILSFGTGQICVKSKMNMKEYYCAPELTASVRKDDWFVSNDLGYIDNMGKLFYRGRKGDVINFGGYKIAPTDVEEVALLSGLINECVLTEMRDEYGIPYIKLLVVPKEKETFDECKLMCYIKDRLENYKWPRSIETVGTIRKTFNGKIDRKSYRS